MSKPLSPQAQAVMDAMFNACESPVLDECAWDDLAPLGAAALRAAISAAGIDSYNPPRQPNHQETEWFVDGKCVRNADIYAELSAIADELEAGR